MSLSGNFVKDFPAAIGVVAGITIAVLIVVCVAAHCGPRMCRMGRKEKWLTPDVEKSDFQDSANTPLVAGALNHPRRLRIAITMFVDGLRQAPTRNLIDNTGSIRNIVHYKDGRRQKRRTSTC
ncbi:hypothetical protein F4782DRAFT_528233 [Xylaria castorea]|nr:hypothetical protein F4782DRAFT_528233 [Xylaria castorea]